MDKEAKIAQLQAEIAALKERLAARTRKYESVIETNHKLTEKLADLCLLRKARLGIKSKTWGKYECSM